MPHGNFFVMLMALVISAFAPSAHAATDPYLRIAEGDSRARVVRLLGEPADPRKDLNAAERKNINAALKITDHKDSVEFAIWKQSSHLYYLIGFNKKDVVATKHRILAIAGAK
jgi:hypothetical protein